ncbi:MAG: hypothetical protein IPM35_14690 [Myxococcales bacterium]|nr:hypothetical protein [Myxococcales bacterium]
MKLVRFGFHVVVALGAVAFGAPSDAGAVFDCLPPRNCQGVAQCCKKPRKELLLQIARAEMRRDFYDSKKNRDEAFAKGAWDSPNNLEKAFTQFISAHQDQAAKQKLGLPANQSYDDVPDLTTHPDCTSSIDANGAKLSITDIPKMFDDPNHPLTKANVCKEAVIAAVLHESEHQDRCEAKKRGLIKPKNEGGWARAELEDSADSERDAYAREADALRLMRKRARQRCTTAKKLAENDFKNARERVKALNSMKQPRYY